MQRPLFIGHEIFRHSTYGRWHPLRVPRVSTVMDLSRALGWLPGDQFVTSPRAKPVALTQWHTPAYIAALQRIEADQIATEQDRKRHDIGSVTNPIFPEIFRRPATAAGVRSSPESFCARAASSIIRRAAPTMVCRIEPMDFAISMIPFLRCCPCATMACDGSHM